MPDAARRRWNRFAIAGFLFAFGVLFCPTEADLLYEEVRDGGGVVGPSGFSLHRAVEVIGQLVENVPAKVGRLIFASRGEGRFDLVIPGTIPEPIPGVRRGHGRLPARP